MAVRFNDSLTPKPYIGATDSASLTLPNSAWSLCFFMQIQANEGQFNYVFSTGAVNSAGALNVVWSSTTPADNHKLTIYLSTLGTSGVVIKTTNTFNVATGWIGVMLSRNNAGSLTLKTCPILANNPTDGSSVTLQGTFATTLTTEFNGSGFAIGARASDLEATRYFNHHLLRIFLAHTAISDLTFAQYCYGAPVESLVTPVWYLKLENNTDTADQMGLLSTSLVGTLSTVSNPSFGYDLAQSNNFEITGGYQNNRVFVLPQVSNATHPIPINGTWSGQIPTSIQYRVYAPNGVTVLQDWTTASNPTINGNGTWSINATVNSAGGKKRLQARSYNGAALLNTSSIRTELFGIGIYVYWIGSSSSSELYALEGWETAPTNPESPMSVYEIVGGWQSANTSSPTTINPMAAFANYIYAQTGLCTLVSTSGIAGSFLYEWAVNDQLNVGTAYTNNGLISAMLLTVGSNDANNSLIVSKDAHQANYQAVINQSRARTNPTIPILVQSSARRSTTSADESQWNFCREAEKDVCNQANVSYNSAIEYETRDGIHLRPDEFARFYQTQLAVNCLRMLQGLEPLKGNTITHIKYKPNSTSAILLCPIVGDGLTAPAGGYTGFTFSDNSGNLTATNYTLNNNSHINVTFSRAIVGKLVVKYLSGHNPIVSNLPRNINNNLPLDVETDMQSIEIIPRQAGYFLLGGF